MACALLPMPSAMETDPGQVIRSLRMALEMSQAEFARAAGWSPSTISSWERGRAKPSRLAFKTILAFAEERGVRYRPRRTSTALVLARPQDDGASGFASGPGTNHDPHIARVERMLPGPRPQLRPLLYTDHLTDAAPRPTAEPPRWSAEASFRFTLGSRQATPRSLPRGVMEAVIVGLAFCAAWLLAEPVQRWVRPAPVAVTAAPVHAPIAPAVVQLPSVTAPAAPAPLPMLVPADAPPEPAAEAPPALVTARLESVLTIGGAARATFRTANDAVTVETGEWLGSQQISRITDDGVILVDRNGVQRRVHVGQQINFD